MKKKEKLYSTKWDNLQSVFDDLEKQHIEYVVLRNFKDLPGCSKSTLHRDIDFLTADREKMVTVLNAQKTKKAKYRTQYQIEADGELIDLDIRFIGDNYYDEAWERKILTNRVKNSNGIYVPCARDYFYSLLYHSIVHKSVISPDYLIELQDELKGDNPLDILNNYLITEKFSYVEPYDLSVYYNYKKLNVNISLKRKLYLMKCEVDYYSKKMLQLLKITGRK